MARGAAVSEPFHMGPKGPEPGPDPEGRSYFTRATFSDPDGNGWVLQEIKTRLPGRTWPGVNGQGLTTNLGKLIEFLKEAEARHGAYEKTAPKHHWSGWYGAYIASREQGKTPEEAVKEAGVYMEGTYKK
jgi:hypothetical protein